MTTYLVGIALGPVQTLIEAARRTRDLWSGSWLLSEVSKAAAASLHAHSPGSLIFPSPANPAVDLQPTASPGDTANIANIIRAEITADSPEAVAELCRMATEAARAHLRQIAASVHDGVANGLRSDVWATQIDSILEVYAAWVEFPPAANGYQQASERLSAALAARKATRDFDQVQPLSTPGLPKSSLDGAFETVLPDHTVWGPRHAARLKLGLSAGEQLDALGVIKRAAGDVDQFTAFARVAANPWLVTLQDEGIDLSGLGRAYEPLVVAKLATRVQGNDGLYSAFPYDAQLLYDFRLEVALAEADAGTKRSLEHLRHTLQPIVQEHGQPLPYAAILKADGDRMGKLLERARDPDASRQISAALHRFASSVRTLVRQHAGHAIYAGGDDVLALVAVTDALPCARALADAFEVHMGPVAESLGLPATDYPSLSVGIGIGHLMEPMGFIRARAGRAEALAKNPRNGMEQRNAVAVIVGVRSGAEPTWRVRWPDQEGQQRMTLWRQAFRDKRLPSRVPYDLRAIMLTLDGFVGRSGSSTDGQRNPVLQGMQSAEVQRLLARARTPAGGTLDQDLKTALSDAVNQQSVATLIDELLVARWLSARTASDLGEHNA